MVANIPATHTPRQYEFAKPAEKRAKASNRQYDSFVVRLWQEDGSDDMLRVELQHVQAGLSIEAVQVPLDWILPKIMGCLQSDMADDTANDDAR